MRVYILSFVLVSKTKGRGGGRVVNRQYRQSITWGSRCGCRPCARRRWRYVVLVQRGGAYGDGHEEGVVGGESDSPGWPGEVVAKCWREKKGERERGKGRERREREKGRMREKDGEGA